MYTLDNKHDNSKVWDSINFEHPATFDTLAMDPELKNAVMEDLNRFISRKEFYKKVGRAWKRGYLLYGPPGTVSIFQAGNSQQPADKPINLKKEVQLTLSGLLNFIGGLWSSCGDERIIIFTTNHKDRLDPALLRPGRMDMHIHLSYSNPQGFKLLASNYLGIHGYHHLFGEIEGLLQDTEVSPAQVAEELMMSEDPDVALSGVVKLLKWKKLEGDDANTFDIQDVKRLKAVVLFNPATDLPIKLLGNVNFATWEAQLVMLLNGHQLIGHLHGSISAPPTAITQNRKEIPNPKYQILFNQNQFIQQALMASVDITIAPTVAAAATAEKAW
ncbi:mitochondrial chaperone BCS1-like [Gossypium australe]|uniref:Mitochondrial chaperone BCS1-like n=1 Tax=Gossypium australe TaxID=47621 RepID=A0A5B6UHE7_9ROSI|nr:mitochondrial chaperone BCS1-like [Gossypium australe]